MTTDEKFAALVDALHRRRNYGPHGLRTAIRREMKLIGLSQADIARAMSAAYSTTITSEQTVLSRALNCGPLYHDVIGDCSDRIRDNNLIVIAGRLGFSARGDIYTRQFVSRRHIPELPASTPTKLVEKETPPPPTEPVRRKRVVRTVLRQPDTRFPPLPVENETPPPPPAPVIRIDSPPTVPATVSAPTIPADYVVAVAKSIGVKISAVCGRPSDPRIASAVRIAVKVAVEDGHDAGDIAGAFGRHWIQQCDMDASTPPLSETIRKEAVRLASGREERLRGRINERIAA
jgi:hypothetical protein